MSFRGGDFHPLDVHGDSLEIKVTFRLGAASRVGLALRRSPDGAEETRILYNDIIREVSIERQQSSLEADTQRDTHTALLAITAGEALTMHVFLDRSIVEVFVNERLCLTTRIYPTRADSLGVGLLAEGGTALIEKVDCWEMKGS